MPGAGGGSVCSIATCKNNSRNVNKNDENVMFFRFPKDIKIQKEWVRKCYRKDKWESKNKRICSKHFNPSDYEDEVMARVLNIQPKKLKANAIPSLFLLAPNKELMSTPRSQRMIQKENKGLVEKLLTQSGPSVQVISDEQVNIGICEFPSSSKESEFDIFQRKLEELQHENYLLKQKNEALQKDVTSLHLKIHELEVQIKENDQELPEKIKIAMENILTPNQIDLILEKKTKVRWTTEELSRAFTIRYFSKRCYIYLRETLHYPLPGLSTLQQWAATINLRSGILGDVLCIMNTAGKKKSERNKITILSFDEIKVTKLYEYSQKEDEIVGPHNYMQVIMARGLFDNWKQPIYIGFDEKMTKEILENAICELHKINYCVIACVSDCGSGNQGLWKSMGITMDNNFSQHPITRDPIYFFADIPHLLKLLRNWFLDVGFTLSNGTVINKEPVKCLIETTRSEISSCFKLNPAHINCEKTQRQNVRLAAQLFLNTTATALKQYLPGEDKKMAKDVGEFIQLINNFFDIMNSYSPTSSLPTKRPYGTNLEMQQETLQKMISTIQGMLCNGKNSLQVFQKGIILSIKSLQGVFTYAKEKYDVKYILTHRLNQDCLENFFSQIRSRGGLHDHPSPINAIYRIRLILLEKNPGIVTKNHNIDISESLQGPQDEYLLTNVIKQAKLGNIILAQPSESTDLQEEVETGSASSSSSTLSEQNKHSSEEDGLIYLAGYLAKKHRVKYPDLGKYTYEIKNATLHSYNIPSWVQNLSFGGLIEPSEEWLQQIQIMNKYFNKLHKDSFSDTKKIVLQTSAYIENKVKDIPKDLIRSFSKQRIFIRLKWLNMKQEEEKTEKRKACDGTRKAFKKMKKIIN